jgi:hypothetical protein
MQWGIRERRWVGFARPECFQRESIHAFAESAFTRAALLWMAPRRIAR